MANKSNYNNLILLTIFITVMIIVSFVYIERYFNSKIEETRISQYQKQQLQISIQTSSTLKDFIEYIKSELISISLSSPPKGYYSIEKKYLSNYYGSLIDSIVSIVRTDKEGNIVKSSEKYLEYDYVSMIENNYFELPSVNPDAYVTQASVETNQYLFVVVPVYGESKYASTVNGEFEGIIVAAIDTRLVEELYFSQIKTGLNSRIWLLNNNGYMLSGPQKWMSIKKGDSFFEWVKETYPQNSNNINKIIAEKEGSIVNDWYPLEKSISSYSYTFFSAGYGWIVIVDTPENEIKEGILPLQQKMLSFLLMIVVSFSMFFIIILIVLKSKEKTEQQLQSAELTLEKLGIKADYEKNNEPVKKVSLKGNHIYLMQEKNEGKGLQYFQSLLGKNYLGLIISRINRESIRKEYGIENTPIIRLGKSKSKEDMLSIIDCKDLYALIKEFMEKNDKTAIYLDRLDYIFENNGFNKTIRFIYDIKDSLSQDSIVLISVNPNSLSSKQFSLISEEVQDITNLISGENIKLPKDLYDILEYINNQYISNKKVVFKDISKEFDITKPTTKKKITELSNLKLVEIQESGREKSLILTKEGQVVLSK